MRPGSRRLRAHARLLALACLGAALARPAAAADAVAAFRQAAARPGGDALADQTTLPFLFEGRPLGRAEFIARAVPALFTPAVRRCLQQARPQAEDGRLVLWCKPHGFYFGKTADGWRLAEFASDAE